MDDFAAKPGAPNMFGLVQGEANAIQPGKRPLSSMTPTILLRDGKLFMVVGAPGGSRIITAVLQVILNVVDFGMNAQDAVDCSALSSSMEAGQAVSRERGFSPDTVALLKARGLRRRCSRQRVVVARGRSDRDRWRLAARRRRRPPAGKGRRILDRRAY